MRLCQALQAQGRAILMVSHDMRVVADWADRVIAMSQGQVVMDSPPRAFFLDVPGLQARRLAQLPICPWRDCRNDPSARCRTCSADFQTILADNYLRLDQELPS
jgi:energy-coupling factor transporter ATP-binding protein EcfA2